MKYSALCLYCKNEGAYLEEWIDYHLLLGIEHFIIYDGSDTPIDPFVTKHVHRGLVTILRQTALQGCAYAQCLREFTREFVWIGFIDTDEFIVVKNGRRINDFLANYEHFGGLGMFWYCFGSNGHLRRQPTILEHFTKRSNDVFQMNAHIKSFINTRFAVPVTPPDPHHFTLRPGFSTVDEFEYPIYGPIRQDRSSRLIQLNHYVFRSQEEFNEKIRRGDANGGAKKTPEFLEYDKECNLVDDRLILHARDELRKGSPQW